MDRKECERLRPRLRGRRRLFYYKDRYALMLLGRVAGEGMAVRELRGSRYARLLDRPVIRELLGRCGDGVLRREQLESFWPVRPEVYRVTLGWWGEECEGERDWYQTSRAGLNLVVRLNFSAEHDRLCRRLFGKSEYHPFEFEHHPIETRGAHTLAWARVDLDLEQGDALIEEIQSDWVRYARGDHRYEERRARRIVPSKAVEPDTKVRCVSSYRALDFYVREVMAAHMRQWAEATLAATLELLTGELGVRRVFYHTWESGSQLKQIGERKPPRSLYSDLPRRFCFETTREVPDFLRWKRGRTRYRGKRRIEERIERPIPECTRFFKLEL